MLSNTSRWSHARGNTVVPSRWQVTAELTSHAQEMGWPGSEGEKVDFAQASTPPSRGRSVKGQ